MKSITNYCNGDKCSRCCSCCTEFAFISDFEIKEIKDYLDEHPEIKECNGIPDFNGRIPMLCPFCDLINKRCTIYEVRPRICRKFQCNKSEIEIDKIKSEFTPNLYHNINDLLSWHKVFFNNDLQNNNIANITQ